MNTLALVLGLGLGLSAAQPTPADVGIDERLGSRLALDLSLVAHTEESLHLGDLLGTRPLLMILDYYRCPTLCGLAEEGLLSGIRELASEGFRIGRDFDVVVASLDPSDTPADAKEKVAAAAARLRDLPGENQIQFLTGRAQDLARLTSALGVRIVYDKKSRQFAHPAALYVLTRDGVISRYLYGVQFSSTDLRLAVVEAGQGRIGRIVDRFILTCYRFDPSTRRYGLWVLGVLRGGAGLVLVVIATMLFGLFRRENRVAS